jgi:tRNA uridine 5-carboxymethylaminomethyl modification enzyme
MGVLVDDLITSGTKEPYRMFTSRAEYRLLLREDNADIRLTEKGRELGLVDDYRWRRFCEKMEAVEKETQRLQSTFIQASSLQAKALESYIEKPLTREARLMDLLKRPELDYLKLMSVEGIGPGVADEQVAFQVEVQAKYAGYISRQQEEIERNLRYENAPIPQDLDYREVKGLSAEVCQKLSESRPQTIGQASRISGVTPAAISLILVYLKKRNLLRKSA